MAFIGSSRNSRARAIAKHMRRRPVRLNAGIPEVSRPPEVRRLPLARSACPGTGPHSCRALRARPFSGASAGALGIPGGFQNVSADPERRRAHPSAGWWGRRPMLAPLLRVGAGLRKVDADIVPDIALH